MRKAFICPSKYVQGEDELLNLGYFVKTFGDSALLIADSFALSLVKDKLEATQKKYGVKLLSAGEFSGECSRTQVAKLKEFAAKTAVLAPSVSAAVKPSTLQNASQKVLTLSSAPLLRLPMLLLLTRLFCIPTPTNLTTMHISVKIPLSF